MRNVSGSQVGSVATALLRWYARAGREMPWRARAGQQVNPYHVLVSEAMLQQTQVSTVRDYFVRFVQRFPTVAALAAAPRQEVLALWQGLGYYRRATHLHEAAKMIVGQRGGQVPTTADELRELPGVGGYTAGAIASIAFGRRAAILDGNVARVLARWFALRAPIDAPATRKRLWRMALLLTPRRRPGDYNQALMDLGATVCTPRSPQCLMCPVATWCRARKQGLQGELPVRGIRRPPTSVQHEILAIQRRGRYLFQQRPARGLWAGLWQLVTVEQVMSAEQLRTWVGDQLGLAVTMPVQAGGFVHQTTHRTITLRLWRAEAQAGRLRRGAGVWRQPGDTDDLPMGNPQRRALALLG